MERIRWFKDLSLKDLEIVGGKNASLGELIQHLDSAGVRVPHGFATTAAAYREFLNETGLARWIPERLAGLDAEDVRALAQVGEDIRARILASEVPQALAQDIRDAYAQLEQESPSLLSVAVRSSATAEDLPEASFAGQQDTYLNVRGTEQVLDCVKKVFASLYTDRAIAYRVHHGFAHEEVALSVGVQQMVRSDSGASGVAFTVDTESGYDGAIFITASYGLGELLVQGGVNPDEFYVHKDNIAKGIPALLSKTLGSKQHKMRYAEGGGITTVDVPLAEQRCFALSDSEVHKLARYALAIEQHYGRPMDIEWGKDGEDGELYILQARPETVTSRASASLERYQLHQQGRVLVEGRSVGQRIGAGRVRIVINASEMERVQAGDVLVADMTDPDWEPVMKRASAIVTNRGGRTCHAAIIARELGIPAVVGTGDATRILQEDQAVTVSCAEGDTGKVYDGELEYSCNRIEVASMPKIPLDIMMNVASPERAFSFAQLPHCGVGLARVEFIINNVIGVHPKALLAYPEVAPELKDAIDQRCAGYPTPKDFFRDKLAEGIAMIASAFAPEKVIVRLSDFKSNEYAHLLGGSAYEPQEENPMIGFRGAARYRAPEFAEAFGLECAAIRHVRETMQLHNLEVMIPFVRTVAELKDIIAILARHGLVRGEQGLRIIMMCEVPSNALLAERFLEYVDGFSIGSNDLTQFTLALDRDSALVAPLFDEQDEAVKVLMLRAIQACNQAGKYVGICGQAPSDHPALALWLAQQGIHTLSLNPDTVVETWLHLAEHLH